MSRLVSLWKRKLDLQGYSVFSPAGNSSPWVPLLMAGAIGLVVLMGSVSSGFFSSIAFSPSPEDSIPPTCEVPFRVEETLVYPAKDRVGLTMVPLEDSTIYVEYGLLPGNYKWRTPTQTVLALEPANFQLKGLAGNKEYYYRVRCKDSSPIAGFGTRDEHSFRTLRNENETFSFLYGTDAHIYNLWATKTWGTGGPGGGTDKTKKFLASMEHMTIEEADFQVMGGDWVMTQCENCEGGEYNGETYAPGSAVTADEALKRYYQTFSMDLYGNATKDLPLVYVLGNHEGEAGFNQTILSASQEARQHFFPEMPASYKSNGEESYYYFETGDALIVVVDVMRYTNVGGNEPKTPEDWTLGQDQMEWLTKVMNRSKKKWKFIFAEHLVGGEPSFSVGNESWYGRGGLRATDTDTPNGTFKGEQAEIQQLMEDTRTPGGATFFLNGHDHVAVVATEKPFSDGTGSRTYMVKGGRVGVAGNGWADNPAFKTEMDWDMSGVADYEEPALGTREVGFFRITVDKKDSVTFEYVLSDPDDPLTNGTVILSKTIYAQ